MWSGMSNLAFYLEVCDVEQYQAANIQTIPIVYLFISEMVKLKGTLRRRLSYGYFSFIAKYASN